MPTSEHLSAVQVSKAGWIIDVQVLDCDEVFGVQVSNSKSLMLTDGRHGKVLHDEFPIFM